MSNVSASASVSAPARVEYDPARRRISLNRVFQIPQMFRPAVSSVAGATIGRLNLERPAIGLTAVASWFRFAPPDASGGAGRRRKTKGPCLDVSDHHSERAVG